MSSVNLMKNFVLMVEQLILVAICTW